MKTKTTSIKKLILTMKPSLIFLIASILGTAEINAQQFHAGLYGGINVTDVDGTILNGIAAGFQKFGFTFGSYVNSPVTANNILQMEIGYSQKGYQNEPDGTHKNNYSQLDLDYIEAALLLRHHVHFQLWNKPRDKFDLEGGVSIGKLIYTYYTVQSVVYPIDINTTDISPFIGISYNYSPNVGVEFRYYNSITPVINRESDNDSYFLYYGSWNRGNNLVFQFKLKITLMGRNRQL